MARRAFQRGIDERYGVSPLWITLRRTNCLGLSVRGRLGEGAVDWDKVRAALLEIGFSGWATREGRDKNLEDTSQLIDQLLIGRSTTSGG